MKRAIFFVRIALTFAVITAILNDVHSWMLVITLSGIAVAIEIQAAILAGTRKRLDDMQALLTIAVAHSHVHATRAERKDN